jgi:hypothetical protein
MATNTQTDSRLPDFIIAGAMKCGTTSLHHILARHPYVFIPIPEIHFFDIDDLQQHPDFAFFARDRWWYPQFEDQHARYLSWYASFFREASPEQWIGEDSTIYLTSRKSAERIRRLLPNVKIIIMLRDPASRTYSQYWHFVRTGRMLWSFEDTLSTNPSSLLERSLYKQHIEHFLQFIPADQVFFVLFEEFIQNMPSVTRDVGQFIGINPEMFPSDLNLHMNRAWVPQSLRIQLWYNRLTRLSVRNTYRAHLPEAPLPDNFAIQKLKNKLFARLHRLINPIREGRVPPMHPQTRAFLNHYFSQENSGLSDLIGQDVEAFWYHD